MAADLAGTLHCTLEGYLYLLLVTEVHTRYHIVYLLKDKSDTEAHMLEAIALKAHHFDRPVARVRVDNSNEFLSKTTLGFSRHRSIAIDLTTPYTPQEKIRG